jgi:pyruvate formate lyase activating enzyme
MERGLVFNVQRFSVHDGPGLRTTVFLKGCPARCPWCHNPESQSHAPELLTFPERCIDCGTCREVCPHGTNLAQCSACGTCAEACPADARRIAGSEMSVSEVMELVTRDRLFYEESNGGVTFSGGEPFAQPAFLRALLTAAKREGISTAVDTCGFAGHDLLLDLAPLVDLFLYDLKMLDPERHLRVIGVPLAPILANLQALAATGGALWLRIPIVPSFTDTDSELDALARLATTLPGVHRVSLLPYHATGAGKFRRLHKDYELAHIAPPDRERMEQIAGLFRARGFDARIGG